MRKRQAKAIAIHRPHPLAAFIYFINALLGRRD
jgi:hypothetical protein